MKNTDTIVQELVVIGREKKIVTDRQFDTILAGADDDPIIGLMVKSGKWDHLDGVGFVYLKE